MGIIAKLAAAGVISGANATVIVAAINAGMTAVSIVAIVGGGGLVGYLVKEALKSKVKEVAVAA